MSIFNRLVPPFTTIARAWTGHYVTTSEAVLPDCVIGFSFGYRADHRKVTPGLSNQDLANVALKHYANVPKILQFEIADAYAASGGDMAKVERISKFRAAGNKTNAQEMAAVMTHLDTREVGVQAQAIMEHRGWKTAVLLAHPFHMPRVQAVCTKLGIAWVATADERGAVEFDPLSDQKWNRDIDHWRGYEPLALMYYRLKGWL